MDKLTTGGKIMLKNLTRLMSNFHSNHFKYTQSPNPNWTVPSPSQPAQPPPSNSISIDPNDPKRSSADNYRLLTSAITPRPIAFISTISKSKIHNLAPFSYFNMVNHNPPIFVVGFSGRTPKNTLQNILDTKELVINVITSDTVEAANHCSIDAPADVSEFELSGLTPVDSLKVAPPRVHESKFSVECVLRDHRDWTDKEGNVTGTTVFVEGVQFHVDESVVNEELNYVDPEKYYSVGRLGKNYYTAVEGAFDIPRPVYK